MVGQFIIKGEILGRKIKRVHPMGNAISKTAPTATKRKLRLNRNRTRNKPTDGELTKKAALFFESKKHLVEKVFKEEPGLFFYVVLKEDSSENRNEVFEFVRDYQFEYDFEKRPLIFQILPKEIEDGFQVHEKVYGYE